MRFFAAAALFALAATPAVAGTVMTIDNRGSIAVTAINSFPVNDAGEAVEDNIGGIIDDVAPATSATFELNGDCGVVRFFVRLANREDEDDLELDVNTCRHRTILVRD